MDYITTKAINNMISKAIEDCFTDSLIYGTGYIKVTQVNEALQIEHVPFADVKKELEGFVELDGDTYKFHGHSGSVYLCHKNNYGMTVLMGSVLPEDDRVEVLEDSDFTLLLGENNE